MAWRDVAFYINKNIGVKMEKFIVDFRVNYH